MFLNSKSFCWWFVRSQSHTWVNQCTYSFHVRNIPESEIHFRPPEMLTQGPFWDYGFSLAHTKAVELLCRDLPPVLCCNITTYRCAFYSVSVGDFFVQLSARCHVVCIWTKSATLKWKSRRSSLNLSRPFSLFFIFISSSFPGTRAQLPGLCLATDYCCAILAPNKSHVCCSLI